MKRCIFIFLIIAANFAVAGPVNVAKLAKAKWLEVKSDNFILITDAKEKKAITIVEDLERFRYFFSYALGYEQISNRKKTVIFILKSSTYSATSIPDKYPGMYVKRNQKETIIANVKRFSTSKTGRSSVGRQIVFHELVHMLMKNSVTNNKLALPSWYGEGTAEYFGSYLEKKGKIYLGDLGATGDRFYSIWRKGLGPELIDTEQLLRSGYHDRLESKKHTDKQYIQKFYARSLALVHYLNADKQRRVHLYKYLHFLKQGASIDESFKAAFQVSYAEMDAAVDKYLRAKDVSARVFAIGKDGVQFPQFSISANKITEQYALEHLGPWLNVLSSAFITKDEKAQMRRDLNKRYPSFKPRY